MKRGLGIAVRAVFGCDLRTLALFRVALGAVLLASLIGRAGDVGAFLSDAGVLPRDALLAAGGAGWSLHLASGSATVQALLLLAQTLAALALIAGHRTRAAAIVGWVLLVSLDARNPLVTGAGDAWLAGLLFWCMFLPLGARYSIDAALSAAPPPADPRHLSWAGAGLTLQVLLAPLCGALLTGRAWWPDGAGLAQLLASDRLADAPGRWLAAAHPAGIAAIARIAYWVAVLAPLAALSPWATGALRRAAIVALALLHLGALALLSLGLLPWVGLASLAALPGGDFWEARRRAREANALAPPKIFHDRDCADCPKALRLLRELLLLPDAEIAPAQDRVRTDKLLQANRSWIVIDERDVAHLKWSAFVVLLRRSPAFRWLGWLLSARAFVPAGDALYDLLARPRAGLARATAVLLPERAIRFEAPAPVQWLAAVALAVVLAAYGAAAGIVPGAAGRSASSLARHLHLEPPLPAPDAPTSGWYVVPGELESGGEADVLHPDRALGYGMPASVLDDIPNARWRAYQDRVRDQPQYRPYYGHWLCRQWNAGAAEGQRLASLKIVYMQEPEAGGAASPIEQLVLWRQDCRAP